MRMRLFQWTTALLFESHSRNTGEIRWGHLREPWARRKIVTFLLTRSDCALPARPAGKILTTRFAKSKKWRPNCGHKSLLLVKLDQSSPLISLLRRGREKRSIKKQTFFVWPFPPLFLDHENWDKLLMRLCVIYVLVWKSLWGRACPSLRSRKTH